MTAFGFGFSGIGGGGGGGGGPFDAKDSVTTVSTGNETLSGIGQTINGHVVAANNRIGIIAQTSGQFNGIYIASAGAWVRSEDADTDDEVTNGMIFFCAGGNSVGNYYLLTTSDPIVLDTTVLSFTEIPAFAGTYLGLTDVPNSFTGDANKFVRVNGAENALQHVAASSINLSAFNNDVGFIASNLYTADGTVGAGRVVTLTDTIRFVGGGVAIGAASASTASFKVRGTGGNIVEFLSDTDVSALRIALDRKTSFNNASLANEGTFGLVKQVAINGNIFSTDGLLIENGSGVTGGILSLGAAGLSIGTFSDHAFTLKQNNVAIFGANVEGKVGVGVVPVDATSYFSNVSLYAADHISVLGTDVILKPNTGTIANNAFASSPSLTLRGIYDSDAGAGVTFATVDAGIKHTVTAAGPTPVSTIDFSIGGTTYAYLKSDGTFSVGETSTGARFHVRGIISQNVVTFDRSNGANVVTIDDDGQTKIQERVFIGGPGLSPIGSGSYGDLNIQGRTTGGAYTSTIAFSDLAGSFLNQIQAKNGNITLRPAKQAVFKAIQITGSFGGFVVGDSVEVEAYTGAFIGGYYQMGATGGDALRLQMKADGNANQNYYSFYQRTTGSTDTLAKTAYALGNGYTGTVLVNASDGIGTARANTIFESYESTLIKTIIGVANTEGLTYTTQTGVKFGQWKKNGDLGVYAQYVGTPDEFMDSPKVSWYTNYDSEVGAGYTQSRLEAYMQHIQTGGIATAVASHLKVDVVGTTRMKFHDNGAIEFTPITATAASAITPAEGMKVFVSTTNGTFTSIGFWGYENGTWVKH